MEPTDKEELTIVEELASEHSSMKHETHIGFPCLPDGVQTDVFCLPGAHHLGFTVPGLGHFMPFLPLPPAEAEPLYRKEHKNH